MKPSDYNLTVALKEIENKEAVSQLESIREQDGAHWPLEIKTALIKVSNSCLTILFQVLKYEIIEKSGSGGFGNVHKVQGSDGNVYAMKVLKNFAVNELIWKLVDTAV